MLHVIQSENISFRLISSHWMHGDVIDIIKPKFDGQPLQHLGEAFFLQMPSPRDQVKLPLKTNRGLYYTDPSIGEVYSTLSVLSYKLRQDFHNCCLMPLRYGIDIGDSLRDMGIFCQRKDATILKFK